MSILVLAHLTMNEGCTCGLEDLSGTQGTESQLTSQLVSEKGLRVVYRALKTWGEEGYIDKNDRRNSGGTLRQKERKERAGEEKKKKEKKEKKEKKKGIEKKEKKEKKNHGPSWTIMEHHGSSWN